MTYSYDQTGYNGLTITNGLGRRTGMSDGSGLAAWSYDLNGNIVTEERKIGTVTKSTSYTYNKDNTPATLTYPSGRAMTFTVSNAQRITKVVDGNGTQYALPPSSGWMYTPTGALASAIYGKTGTFTGITEARTYNNRLQLTGVSATSSGGTPLNLAPSYNANGEIATITDSLDTGRTQSFTYDSLSRITAGSSGATSGADCWGQTFTIDNVANLTNIALSKCSGGSFNAAVNQNNQFSTGYTYDGAGNLTNDGIYTYAYNGENEITSANSVTYTYDGNRMRVEKSSGTLYWRTGGSVISETNLSGADINEYVFFAGRRVARIDSSGNVYYYQADQIGSTRTGTNSSGTLCYDADFTPYGSEIAHTTTCAQNYKFTGYERDSETGLDYAMNRYYNPRMGRFMNPDPSGIASAGFNNPQSLHRYAYAINNPLKYVDPTGLYCFYGGIGDTLENDPDPTDYDFSARNPGDCAEGGVWIEVKTTIDVTADGCPGTLLSGLYTGLIMGAGGPITHAAQLLAVATGHVVTAGYDASATATLGTLGGTIHAGDALAFDPNGNIALISTNGAGGGFSGTPGLDAGVTGQLGYLRATSVFDLENGSTPTFNFALGVDGVQGGVGTDLEGNVTVSVGAGEGVATSSTVDVSHVSIVACNSF